ncbi:hypothetical protein BGZ72_006374 [Mortierella alpina]|nr:hypothetical protein BGZ72_006374 [Mortierella alpina]
MLAQTPASTAITPAHYSETQRSAAAPSEPTSLAEQYRKVILDACEEATFGQAGGDHAHATFSLFKDDKLRHCLGKPALIGNKRVAPDAATQREIYKRVIPDPELQHPVSQRVIGEFVRYYSTQSFITEKELPYKATAGMLSSYRSKVLIETCHYANELPKPAPQEGPEPTEEQLAAAFMRGSGDGPLDDSDFAGDHYLWAAQYKAVKKLSGAGKSEKAISFREEMKKPLQAMHSCSTISLTIATNSSMYEDPILRKKLYTLSWAWVSDSDWAEATQFDRDGHGSYSRNIQHVLLGHQAQNASLGYEKICEVQRQEAGTLIRPAWLCYLTPEERQRMLLAQCYADFHVNCESHQDLIEDEGYRSRYRLSNMVFGANPDSYDEWTQGEANNGAMLCGDCVKHELKATLAPEYWDSEDYDFIDRWQYSAQLYFYHSARHNYTLARFIHFDVNKIDSNLASYNQTPLAIPTNKKNSEIMAPYMSAIGLSLPADDELADRIASSYDWNSISGLCNGCIESGAVDEWFAATLGSGLAARHLSLLEKARLSTYLDCAGFNVFPNLFRGYNSQCGCVGRWSKRLHMVAFPVCNLYTAKDFSSVLAVREALADSIKDLNDHQIADLLRGVHKEIEVGRQAGHAYRANRELEIIASQNVVTPQAA